MGINLNGGAISASGFGGKTVLTEQVRLWGFCALALSLVFGCSVPTPTGMPPGQVGPPPSAPTSEINQALSLAAAQSSSSTANYRIGPDDLVQVTVYNIPEQDARVTPRSVILRVSQEGAIVLPLVGEVAVIGGPEVNALLLPLASRVELTEVHADYEGDTIMPPLGPEWRETFREEHGAADSAPAFAFVTLRRDL